MGECGVAKQVLNESAHAFIVRQQMKTDTLDATLRGGRKRGLSLKETPVA